MDIGSSSSNQKEQLITSSTPKSLKSSLSLDRSLNDSNLVQFDLCTPKRKKLIHHRQLVPYSITPTNQSNFPQQLVPYSITPTNQSNYYPQQQQQQVTNSLSTNSHNNTITSSSSSYHSSFKNQLQQQPQQQFHSQQNPSSIQLNSNNKYNSQSYRAFKNHHHHHHFNSTIDEHQLQLNRINDKISLTHCNNSSVANSSINIPIIKSTSNNRSSAISNLNSIQLKRILQSPTTNPHKPWSFETEEVVIEQQSQEEEEEEKINTLSSATSTTSSTTSDLIIPSSLATSANYYDQQENNSTLANSFSRYLIYKQIPLSGGDIIYCSFNWLMGQKNSSVLKSANSANGSPTLNTTVQQHNLNLTNSPSSFLNTGVNTSGNSSIGLNHSGHPSSSIHHSILSNSFSLGSSNFSNLTLNSSSGSPTNGNILGNSSTISSASHNQSAIAGASSQNGSNGGVLWRSSANKNNISNLNNNNNNNSKNTIYNECNELIGQRPNRLDTILDMPPVSHEVQVKHSWNPDDRSLNIFVKEEDPFTLHRHPVAQSTDCIRSRMGYTRGLHVFQIHWNVRQRGTHAVIGVCTIDAALHAQGYQALIGSFSYL